MATAAMTTPDASASLARLQKAIKDLRETLNDRAVDHFEHPRRGKDTNGEGPDELVLEDEDGDNIMSMSSSSPIAVSEATATAILSHTAAVKAAHDSIMRDVEASRTNIRNIEDELLHVRLRLDNLEYENRVLKRDITICRNVKSPKLVQTGVRLPTTLFDSKADDDHMARNLKEAKVALENELNARKKLQEDVERRRKDRDEKRKRLLQLRENLKSIPQAARQIHEIAESVQKSVKSIDN